MEQPTRMMSARFGVVCSVTASMLLVVGRPCFGGGQEVVKYNWLDFGSNPQHDNFDRDEKIISRANVGRLKPLWSITVGDWVDREPLYVHDLNTIAGKKDVVFVNTKKGECAAFDALTGAKIWMTPSLCSKG